MKIRKSKIVITSLLSVFGVALLGVTSAKWALTDNADPFHVLITAGNLPEKGYYITFGEDGYFTTGEHCALMDAGEDDNLAQKTNVHIDDNDTVRIYYYDGNTNEKISSLTTYSFGEAHGYAALGGDNATITFDTARHGDSYSFYLKEESSELKLYMVDETYALYNGYYITKSTDNGVTWCDFNEAWKMDDTSGDNVAELTHAFETGVKYRVEHFAGMRGIISSPNVQGADYSHFTNSVHDNETIDFKAAGNYKFMVSNTTNKTYIAKPSAESLNGYYILYASHDYDYLSGTKMDAGHNGNLAELSLDIAKDETIKIKYIDAVNDVVSGTYTLGAAAIYINEAVSSETITFNKADKYDIYLNGSGEIHTAIGSYHTVYLNDGGSSLWGTVRPDTTKLIYFTNDQGWSTVKAYAFNKGTDAGKTSWPGEDATLVGNNELSQPVYCYEVDTTAYDYVIFNNGSTQTEDIRIDNVDDCTGFYISSWNGGKGVVTSYKYADERATTPIIYAWVWEPEKEGRWVEMIPSITHTGYGYEITIHSYETGIKFARCAYVPTSLDGSELLDSYKVWNQTSDLTIPGDGYGFTITDWNSGSWSTNAL